MKFPPYRTLLPFLLLLVIAWMAPARVQAQAGARELELLAAIEAGDVKKVKELVKKGADVNTVIPVEKADYLFHISREKFRMNEVGIFGVNKNAGVVYITPLAAAANQHNLDIVKLLLKKHANADAADSDGKTAMMYALRNPGGEAVALYLLKKGANYVVQDYAGNTVLHYAAFGGNAQGIHMALGGGLDINGKNKEGITPLHAAAFRSDLNAVKLLLDLGADPAATDTAGMNAIHYCAAAGNQGNASFLITDKSVPACLLSSDGYTPMDIAGYNNHTEFVEWIKAKNCYFYSFQFQKLVDAVKSGDILEVNKLVRLGVSASRITPQSPLHLAAESGQTAILEVLFRTGVDVNLKDASGKTPYETAVNKNQYKTALALVNRKVTTTPADLARLCSKMRNPGDAAAEGYRDLVVALLNVHDNLTLVKDEQNETPLHFAALTGDTAIARLLFFNQAPVNAVNLSGLTPLHSLCLQVSGAVDESNKLKILRQFGSLASLVNLTTTKDYSISTVDGMVLVPAGSSVADILHLQGDVYPEIAKLVQAAGGKPALTSAQWYSFGLSLKAMDKKASAAFAFAEAVKLDKENTAAWLEQGKLLAAASKPKEAAASFTEYLNRKKDNHEAFAARGEARFSIRDYKGASEDFSAALKLDPGMTAYLYYRGQTWLKLQDKPKACADFTTGANAGDAKCANSLSIHCK